MTEPTHRAVLFDGDGNPMWIATTAVASDELHAHMQDVITHSQDVQVFKLTADGVDALNGKTGKAGAVREVLKSAIAEGYTVAWMVSPKGDDDEPPAPAAAPASAGTAADAAVILAKIEEARSALLARVTGGRLRTRLSHPDVYSPDVFDALQDGGITPQLMLASTALHWAIGHGKAGNLAEVMTWCARLHEHLASVPGAVDNPADHIRLVWVDDRDDATVGNVSDLAKHIEMASLGGDGAVDSVYVFRAGQPVKLRWEVTGTPYDEEQWATNTLTVTLTDGSKLTESWKVDGAV